MRDRLLFKLLVLRAWLIFLRIDVGFRRHSFEHVLQWVSRENLKISMGEALRKPEDFFEAVKIATAFYYRKRRDCLPKALTTFYLLRRSGQDAELLIGARQFPFEAHAWVHCNGTVLDDFPGRVEDYTILHRVEAIGHP